MKKIIASIGMVFVAAAAFGITQTKPSPDKPWNLYRLSSYQNRQDDVDVTQHLYFRQPDGTVQNYASVRWLQTDFWAYGWLSGLGGAGERSDNYYQESWDADGNHSVDYDNMGLDWPFLVGADGNGTGDAVYYSHGTAYETNAFEKNIWEYSADEHCQVEDGYPLPKTWDSPEPNSDFRYLWRSGHGKETYQRKAQTIWHIQTGGRAIPFILNPPSVYQFSGYASEIKDIRETPPFDGTYTLPIAPGAITINGKPLEADHIMYQTLPDDAEYDVTPRVAGNDFYTFSVGASKHTLTSQTWHPALTDPDPSRSQVGVGEEVNVYLDPPLQMTFPETPMWSVSGGTIDLVESSGTKFTAAYNKCIADVTVHIRDVDLRKSFSVVEPDGVELALITSTHTNDIALNKAGAKMDIAAYIAPMSVSFYRVSISEVGQDASEVKGYFSNTNLFSTNPEKALHHYPGHSDDYDWDHNWYQLGENNRFPDQCSINDVEGLNRLPQPWSTGSFKWNIPVDWKIGERSSIHTSGWDQIFTIDVNGTVSITKLSQTVTRTTNNVVIPPL